MEKIIHEARTRGNRYTIVLSQANNSFNVNEFEHGYIQGMYSTSSLNKALDWFHNRIEGSKEDGINYIIQK